MIIVQYMLKINVDIHDSSRSNKDRCRSYIGLLNIK